MRLAVPLLSALVLSTLAVSQASADKIRNPTAIFSGLDKVTGRIVSFEVAIDETVQFGALQLTPRVCYTRPETETPNTTAFIEVDEVTVNNEYHRIFTGWVFAASPGLHGIEHPVYDIWLTGCANPRSTVSQRDGRPEGEPNQGAFEAPRRRVRR